ncbi:hypothetical protein RIN66_04045 [Hafnia alvei]|uniref:hypothetical protein n=1 Tax=Hafnia alvei TaxID=569 RepID=UPI0028BE7603|nr:hypothetical protein [Hafnia alvei]WNN53242.1 hypothetical protein RIN66_04045 [Hafnia alvei]
MPILFFSTDFFFHAVMIEEGTTLANFFFAIEPWKELLTAYLDLDIGAYIDEVKNYPNPLRGIWSGLASITEALSISHIGVRIWNKVENSRHI